jgi:hypothetical protein
LLFSGKFCPAGGAGGVSVTVKVPLAFSVDPTEAATATALSAGKSCRWLPLT